MKITGQDPAKTAELSLGKTRSKDAAPAQGARQEGKAQPARQSARPAAQLPSTSNLTTTKARDAIRREPDVRADKVADVKARLKNGRYEIDADKLAGKMLDDSLREDIEKP
jgi:negative regulator of flagellin synthesis FlgM